VFLEKGALVLGDKAQQKEPDEIQEHDTQHCQASHLKEFAGADNGGKSRDPRLEELFFTMWLPEAGLFHDGLVRCRQVLSMVPAAQSEAQQVSGTGRVENSEKAWLGVIRCPEKTGPVKGAL